MSDTLEDFLGRYVRNKKLANSAESYEKWLSAYGTDADAALGERLSDIEKSYESAKSTYGKNAERLAALGLSSSGYSDYLNGAAYAEKERAKSAAYRTAAETEAKNRRGYERYLASYRDGQDTLLKEAYKTIAASGTFDEDGAYRRAISMGLDGAAAKEAAAGGPVRQPRGADAGSAGRKSGRNVNFLKKMCKGSTKAEEVCYNA